MIFLTDLERIFLPLGIPKVLIKLIFDYMPKWICKKNKDKIILSNDFFNIFSDDIAFWHDHPEEDRPYKINDKILNDTVYYLMYLISRGERLCDCKYSDQEHTQSNKDCSCVDGRFDNLYYTCPCHYLYYTCDVNQKYVSSDIIEDDNDIEIISIHSHNLNNELESFIEYNDGNNFEEKFNELVEFIHTFSSSNLNEVYVKSIILLDNIRKIKQLFSVPNNKLMVLK